MAVDYDVVSLGLDQTYWNDIAGAVEAAYNRDRRLFLTRAEHLKAVPPHAAGGAKGVYLYVMLQAQILFTLDRVPSLDELDDLTTRLYPDFENLLKRTAWFPHLDRQQLLGTLSFTILDGESEERVRGTRWSLGAAAACGLLMDDPKLDTYNLTKIVAKHWAERKDEYLRVGTI